MSDTPVAGSILGAAVKRTEDPRFITGTATYVGDMHREGEVWMVPVRSPVPHGVVTGIDSGEAGGVTGFVGCFTAADLPGRMPIDFADQPEVTRSPLINGEVVRFVGDIVAVVVAETEQAAVDAAHLVWVDIDPLPPVPDVATALATGAPLLFPELGSNVVKQGGLPPAPDALEGADEIVRLRVVHQRVAAVPLETNNALAIPAGDHLEIWMGTQAVHDARNDLSTALGIDRERIRVRVPDMGGGFGAKIATYREHVICAALALKLGRPVRWNERRTENLVGMTHGRAQIHDIELGARSDGSITGMRISVIQDVGGWPVFGADLPIFTQRMAAGPYHIPRLDFSWRSVMTTTTPVHAYRGAGRPEATVTLERALDVLASRLAIDPVDIRRRNFLAAESFPVMTATGERYDTGEYDKALDLAMSKIDYRGLRAEQADRRKSGDRRQLGIGVATYVEVTAPGGRKDWGAVEVHADGSATVSSGSVSHGHGHETTFVQIAARALEIPPGQIGFIQADTATVTRGGGTMGSRSLQMVGSAVLRSSREVIQRARRLVAAALEAAEEDITLGVDGRFGVAGVPDTALTWSEVHALAVAAGEDLRYEDVYLQTHPTVPFGAHISIVEVDTETGDVRLLRHVACDDAGVIVNRLVLDGQIHGGVAQGIGQALFEQVRFDEAANPLTTNLTAYLLPTAGVLPGFEVDHTVTPSPENPLGVKGVGEAGTIGSTPAVLNAVLDAIRPLGVDHLDMPLSPGRVWSALRSAAGPTGRLA
jgi:carbon-monoxide dehydrogenase large subunit